MATGLLSRGITLSYRTTLAAFANLPDLQEIPEMGATAEKVEVTTLADTAKRYINGLKDYGEMAFKFLYANTASDSFYILRALESAGTLTTFRIEFPDYSTFVFSGYVSVKIDSAGVNAPLTFTLNINMNTDITIALSGYIAVPVISTASLAAGSNRAFAGTCASGATIAMVKNGAFTGATVAASGTNWTYTIPAVVAGEVWTVYAQMADYTEKVAATSLTATA
jgi:hypothetical protein